MRHACPAPEVVPERGEGFALALPQGLEVEMQPNAVKVAIHHGPRRLRGRWQECSHGIRVHIWSLDKGGFDEQAPQPCVEPEEGLELFNASRGVEPNRIVREADDAEAGRV